MPIIVRLFQFLPLSVFLYFSRQNIETGEANWAPAFQAGALAAVLELMILIPILKAKISRLITAVNLYLIIGGLAFFLNLIGLLNLIGKLRETGLLMTVIFVVLLSIVLTKSGAFENAPDDSMNARKYSIYFLGWCVIATVFSWMNKGQLQLAGVVPFISLIIVKYFLWRRLNSDYIHKKKN